MKNSVHVNSNLDFGLSLLSFCSSEGGHTLGNEYSLIVQIEHTRGVCLAMEIESKFQTRKRKYSPFDGIQNSNQEKKNLSKELWSKFHSLAYL